MNEEVFLAETAVAPPAPGAQLAAARASSGLSVTDIARQLKLSPWQVEALESGDYRRLPGAVFVRGFIRNYARVVKLDVASLLANVAQGAPPGAAGGPRVAPSADIPFPTGREFKWHKYAIAAIVVLVPVVIFEFYLDDTPEATVSSSRVVLPIPEVAGPANPADQAAYEQAAPVPADVPETAASAAPGAAPAAANARRTLNEHRVRFRFAQSSWVEIRDRAGRKIFSQFNPAGTEQVVSGMPPLTLVVGNAKGVNLTYNEQPVDLGPHTKVDVARLTLD